MTGVLNAVPRQGSIVKQQQREHYYFDISTVERRIIHYLAHGYSDKEIADDLRIAPGTVRNRVIAIKRRTGLRNRTHMVAYALTHGIIDTSPGNRVAFFKN